MMLSLIPPIFGAQELSFDTYMAYKDILTVVFSSNILYRCSKLQRAQRQNQYQLKVSLHNF